MRRSWVRFHRRLFASSQFRGHFLLIHKSARLTVAANIAANGSQSGSRCGVTDHSLLCTAVFAGQYASSPSAPEPDLRKLLKRNGLPKGGAGDVESDGPRRPRTCA